MAKVLIGNLRPPIAKTDTLGISKPDGTTIGIDENGTLSSLVKASGLDITDTKGLTGEENSETNTQALIDAIANKVINELVSKNMISTTIEDSDDKVASTSLVYQLNNNLESNTTAITELNSDFNKAIITGTDFTGINAPAQSDGSFYRAQLLSDGRFRIAKNIDGTFDSWKDFLTTGNFPLSIKAIQLGSGKSTTISYLISGVITMCILFAVRSNDCGVYAFDTWNGMSTIKDNPNLEVSVESNRTITVKNNGTGAVNIMAFMNTAIETVS